MGKDGRSGLAVMWMPKKKNHHHHGSGGSGHSKHRNEGNRSSTYGKSRMPGSSTHHKTPFSSMSEDTKNEATVGGAEVPVPPENPASLVPTSGPNLTTSETGAEVPKSKPENEEGDKKPEKEEDAKKPSDDEPKTKEEDTSRGDHTDSVYMKRPPANKSRRVAAQMEENKEDTCATQCLYFLVESCETCTIS